MKNQILEREIVYRSDFQTNWSACIEVLNPKKFYSTTTEMLSIHGDAPKDFVGIRQHSDAKYFHKRHPRKISNRRSRWPKYIAKVGSKWYPIESITEHLVTRIGQILKVKIADSQLSILGGQVRFLSKYFLKKDEILYHGYDLFSNYLGQQIAEQIAASREESHLYTFQTIGEAVLDKFHEQYDSIMGDLAEMIAFDALLGMNDRHAANWGIVVKIDGRKPPKFAPIYDSARALFWNNDEKKIAAMLTDQQRFGKYITRTTPLIGWCTDGPISHFDLVRSIATDHPEYSGRFQKFQNANFLSLVEDLLSAEFEFLMSSQRRELIVKCLERRQSLFRSALTLA